MAKSHKPILAGTLDALQRCAVVVDHLDTDQFAGLIAGESGVGPHLRHCVEHFVCLLDGLNGEVIDYDSRARDEELETNPDSFRQTLARVETALDGLDPKSLTRVVCVRQIPSEGADAVTVESTLARELLFLTNHTVHHIAIVRMLANALGVTLPESLALAPSTATYRANLVEQE